MHRCLHILDILTTIFDMVHKEAGIRTVAALAMTCRAFQDTALNVIWRTIPSLFPLVKCLPSEAWQLQGTRKLVLLRLTTGVDWVRCQAHARRIRYFGPNRGAHVKFGDDIVQAMVQHGILPLPNLRGCTLSAVDSTTSFVLSSTVSELRLSTYAYKKETRALFPLMSSLQVICPYLRQITLDKGADSDHRFDPSLSKTIGNTLAVLKHLEEISCKAFCLPDHAVRVLASSLTLRIFHTRNTPKDILRCFPGRGIIFPQLESLAINFRSMKQCSKLMARIGGRCLTSISLVYVDDENPIAEPDIREFFRILAKHCDPVLLRCVCVCDDDYGNPRPEPIVLDTFRPLFQFKNLDELDIRLPISYDLDNDSIKSMVEAWPLMQHFELAPNLEGWEDEIMNKLTLDVLVLIARGWPNLRFLSIFLSETCPPPPFDDKFTVNRPGGGACCHALDAIHIVNYTSFENHRDTLAAFLTDIFPNLNRIECDEEEEVDLMNEMIRMAAAVRRQERWWAANLLQSNGIMLNNPRQDTVLTLST